MFENSPQMTQKLAIFYFAQKKLNYEIELGRALFR
jgi:hypothetical protein